MCELESLCWRRAYDLYLRDNLDTKVPPPRVDIMLGGYISPSCYPKGGVFCKHLPVIIGGRIENECPDSTDCFEYTHYKKRAHNKGKREVERPPRVYISKEIRNEVARRCKYKCVYCGQSINSLSLITGERVKGAVDHFIPLSKGGSNDISNLVLSCRDCNTKKSDNIWERKLCLD